MNNKKSLWQRVGSLLVALGMVVGIVMPSLPVAWAASPTPVSVDIVNPVVMYETAMLGEMNEYDPVNDVWHNFWGYNPGDYGAKYTITYDDGTTETLHPGEVQDRFGEPVIYTVNQFDANNVGTSKWVGGNTYTGTLMLYWDNANNQPPITGSYTVDLRPNPVAAFTIDEMRPLWGFELREMYHWDDTLQQEVTFRGYVPRDAVQKMTMTLSDGTVKTYTRGEDDNDIFYELEDDLEAYCGTRIWVDERHDQSPTNLWSAGNHTVQYELCGKTQTVNVEILPNPVAGFTVDAVRPLLDCEDTSEMYWWDEVNQQDVFFDGYDARSAVQQLTVTMADGTVKTFDMQRGNPAYEMEEYVRQAIGTDKVWLDWESNQTPVNPWGVGTHTVNFRFAGHIVPVQLQVQANPVLGVTLEYNRPQYVEPGQKLYEAGVDMEELLFHVTTASGTATYKGTDTLYGRMMFDWLQYDNHENFEYPGLQNGWDVGTYTCTGATVFGYPVTVDLRVVCPEVVVYTAAEFKAAVENPDIRNVFLGADIDLSSVGTVTVPNKPENFLWIDTCAWDLTSNTTLLNVGPGVIVHIGEDYGKPNSNPDPEAETEFSSGSAPMFHVEGTSVLQLTSSVFYNAQNLLTANTAGIVELWGGMYENKPNAPATARPQHRLQEAYVDEVTGNTWWTVVIDLDVTLEGTGADGSVADFDTPGVTTPGTAVTLTGTIKNTYAQPMDYVNGAVYYAYASDWSTLYDASDLFTVAVNSSYTTEVDPESGVTFYNLGTLQPGQEVTFTMTGNLPTDKPGELIEILLDAFVRKPNVDNDPSNPYDDYEWIGSTAAPVDFVMLNVTGDVEADVPAAGGGTVGSTPNAELVQNATTANTLKQETLAIVQDVLSADDPVDELQQMVDDGVLSAEAADGLMAVLDEQGLTAEITTTVVMETLTEVPDATEDAMILQAGDGELHYFDLSLLLSAGGEQLGTVHKLSSLMPIVITLPDEYRTGSWQFSVLREHNGVVEPLMFVDNGDGTLTIYTDRFSTYAIAAKAVTDQPAPVVPTTPAQPTSPKTGESMLPAVFGLMALVSGAGLLLDRKKQH